MTKGRKGLVLLALVGVFVLAFGAAAFAAGTVDLGPGMGSANKATGGGLEAAAIGELGNTEHGPVVKSLLDLPALNVGEDAQGRVIMDLPGLKLVGKAKGAAAPAPGKPGAPGKLPRTGANVGDLAAMGMAALSAGGVLARRLRLSLAS